MSERTKNILALLSMPFVVVVAVAAGIGLMGSIVAHLIKGA